MKGFFALVVIVVVGLLTVHYNPEWINRDALIANANRVGLQLTGTTRLNQNVRTMVLGAAADGSGVSFSPYTELELKKGTSVRLMKDMDKTKEGKIPVEITLIGYVYPSELENPFAQEAAQNKKNP